MRAAVFRGPGDVRVEQVPDPRIEAPTDAVVQVTHACICGSDLWSYRGLVDVPELPPGGRRVGHEWLGVVTDVGAEVRSVAPGDRVIAPFVFSDGTCEFCEKGLQTSCVDGGVWGGEHDGGQGEAVRCPWADGTLVRLPPAVADDPALLAAALPLTDVMATGHHAAVSAGVTAGSTVAVVGDGAVGLCGVLAARRLGAERIIALGHHRDRLDLARRFGATDVVLDDDPVPAVRELTAGGAPSVLECVGTQGAVETALDVARDGGTVGYVGVPAGVKGVPLDKMFGRNVGLRGGVAPARAYLPELLADVAAGRLDPSPVLDRTVDLDGVPDGYAAMADRTAIKVMIAL
ncbi:MAG: alcohol dehydrogenase catalytic domain-containing protein [Actinomycetota bacterium]|nr:alcohol dehydrogenase catalytic domain-containing protein [Actinomycetota bacterium]